jgi:hypothetical protein
MKMMRGTVMVGALLLAGCTTNTAVIVPMVVAPQSGRLPLEFTVLSGQPTMLRRVFMLNADCSVSSYPAIRVTSTPTHGYVTIARGAYYPNYPLTNQRYACNLKPQAGVAVFYQSDLGYLGPDNMTLDVIRADGVDRTLDYHLIVK